MMIAKIMDLRHITAEQHKNHGKNENRAQRKNFCIKEIRHPYYSLAKGDYGNKFKAFHQVRKADDTDIEFTTTK